MIPESSDHEWAMAIVNRALARVRRVEVARGNGRLFRDLEVFLSRDCIDGEWDTLAKKHLMPRQALTMKVNRLRAAFCEAIADLIRTNDEWYDNRDIA